MKKCTLSIIVPIYNVEEYLEKCLHSLVEQNTNDYEIILINDGSKDNSVNICEKYIAMYPNIIKYYYKENSGLSDARNMGLKNSVGDYVCFIDSDDYIDFDVLPKFIEIMKNKAVDIIYFGYYYEKDNFIEKRFTYKSYKEKKYKSEYFMINELSKRNLPIPACFAFYKKSLIINNKLYFESGILHEDERWSPQILLASNEIYCAEDYIYHYIQRENSITHKKDKTKNGLDLIDTANFLNAISDDIENKKLRQLFKNRIAMLYMKGMCVGNLYRKEYRKYINKFFPWKNTCFFKDKIKAILFLFNLRCYCILNKRIKGD